MSGRSYVGSGENRYLFQGKELQPELGDIYSFEIRNYDAALGRWWQVDPKANEFESPYAGMSNNPLRYIDPLGDTVKFADNLSVEQLKQLNNTLNDLKKDEAFSKLYGLLGSSETVFTIGNFSHPKADKNTNGFFNHKTNEVSILNFGEGSIHGTVVEELFHAFQSDFYGVEKTAELRPTTALETEAKLFRSQNSGNYGISDKEAQFGLLGVSATFNFATSQETANYVKALQSGGVVDSKVATKFETFYRSQHGVVQKIYKNRSIPSGANGFQIGAFKKIYDK